MVHFKRMCRCEQGSFYEGRNIPEGGYGDDWNAGFNLRITGSRAHVSLFMGVMDRNIERSIKRFCADRNVKEITYDRRGTIKVVHLGRDQAVCHYEASA